ncbi:MAG: nucleoside recognition domain-containing protein [Crocinitomicaceae bacterium]|nr:nucleoside recognition domain-containing protein [Crocinitomicaceae bacterium]MDG1735487.1 nucleoside recognition domain-containing protein [Crocinitomicaceae bacterium]
MVLNRIWFGMFLIAIALGFYKTFLLGDYAVMKDMIDSLSSSAKVGFELSLYLTGAMCLWLGIMRVGENGGAIKLLTKAVSPLFSKLFPDIPEGHPSVGSMMMNFSANMLGLDNAATPLGLKAMKELQEINPIKDRASNAQIMFLVLNTSGLTIIPISIFALRSGAESPTEVFLPILISTFIASLAGLTFVAIRQKINLFNPTVISYLGGLSLLIGLLLHYVVQHPSQGEAISVVVGGGIMFSIISVFILLAIRKKVNVYESFIDGAKGGFNVAISIIPYLIAILCAIALFRASGALDGILDAIRWLVLGVGLSVSEWVDALPVAFMKPLSGGGARGAYVEVMNNFGVGSLQELIAATMQGSTETTFYVIAVYFGSVGIKKTRYAVTAGLFADLIGIIAAIIVSYIFFG